MRRRSLDIERLLKQREYFLQEIKTLEEKLTTLRERNELSRRIWREECFDEGFGLGTPFEALSKGLQKKWWTIRKNSRLHSDPLEARAQRMMFKLNEVTRAIEKRIPPRKSKTKHPEWKRTLTELAQHAVNECGKGKYRGEKLTACRALIKKYRYKGKRINESTLYRYMRERVVQVKGDVDVKKM